MSTRSECPACTSSENVLAFEVEGYPIARCGRCASLFVRDLPTSGQIQAIYLQGEYYSHPPENAVRIRAENVRRCRTLKRLTDGRRLLDVGCAVGHLLDTARSAGFEVVGVDQTPHTIAEARARGHQVFEGTLEDLVVQRSDQEGQYDVVAALDVIEHVPDPGDFLQNLVNMARPGGLVVLSTPNYSGLVARMQGRRDPFMIPPDHLNFFTFSGLGALADRTQVRIERAETFGCLTVPEMRRQGSRFLPGVMKPLHLGFGRLIDAGIRSLNLFSAGIEAEVYLRKPLAAIDSSGRRKAA